MLSDYPAVIVLDLETTGLDHRTEGIIEIGAVRLEKGQVVDTFETFVNPGVPIRNSSYKVHWISEEMIADAPTLEDVMPKVLNFVEDLPFVAHNALFDYSFLNEASKRLYEKRLPNLRIDTFDIFRTVFPDEPSHGLSAMLAKFGFASHVKHRALDDAMNLARVYPKLLALYEQQKSWQLSQIGNVPYLVERYLRLQKNVQMLQAEMSDLREVFKLYFQEGGQPFTVSTGDTILSSYRRNYEYHEPTIRALIKDAGLQNQAYKLNAKAIDRLCYSSNIDLDVRQAIKDARVQMSETRQISFVKPEALPQAPLADPIQPGLEVEVSDVLVDVIIEEVVAE